MGSSLHQANFRARGSRLSGGAPPSEVRDAQEMVHYGKRMSVNGTTALFSDASPLQSAKLAFDGASSEPPPRSDRLAVGIARISPPYSVALVCSCQLDLC
jgi:hypothetical protein